MNRSEEQPETDGGAIALPPPIKRAVLVFHVEGRQPPSSLVGLPEDAEVTIGRSRAAMIVVDHEAVSRLHARIRRIGDVVDIEDLESRNGTHVNGVRVSARTRIASGDEVTIGPMRMVLSLTSALRTRRRVVTDARELDMRFAAEVDRSVRYRRPMTVALARVPDDSAVDAMARELRAMDLIAHEGGDEYLVLLPELGPAEGGATVDRLLALARRACAGAVAGTVSCPDDGTTPEELVDALRGRMTGGRARRVSGADERIVQDLAMRRVYDLVRRVADRPVTVLILGETGVGKECVAEALHEDSNRRYGPFIRVNCAALSEGLLESELFGHEQGAFTGADRPKIGLFHAAAGGTLFLDEIGDLAPALQVKMLRVLDRKAFARLGALAEIPVDARVIAASHRDLVADMRTGRFRQDLFHRLSAFTITVPPLRERPGEILVMAEHFVRSAARELQREPPVIAADAREVLTGYAWPGNVRELKNAISRALVFCGAELTVEDLPEKLRDAGRRLGPVPLPGTFRGQLAAVERAAILAALDAEHQNQTRAARRLGISRRALVYKLDRYGIR